MRRSLCLLMCGLVTTTVAAAQGSAPVLVTGEWLATRLSNPGIAVLHVASSRAEYDAGHIPGARFVAFSAVAPSSGGLNMQLPPAEQLDTLLESAGVSDGMHVVLYGQPLLVSRAFVTLEYVGLAGRVSVLDGGIDAWREARRAVSNEPVTVARGRFTPNVKAALVVDAPWVHANTARPGIALLDARAPEFYLGYSAGQMPRAGHIPNAGNVPFSSLGSELSTMRDEGKVRALFEAAGAMKGDTVVTYCHIGMQASLLYFNARRLGFVAKIYDGSFEDWSKRPELPVEVKAKK